MLKKISTLLGVGLLVLWIAGLGSPNANGWLTWLHGLAGLMAFAIAGFTPNYARKSVRVGQPIALSVGLFLVWLGAMSAGAIPWQTGWTLAFACAFLVLGVMCAYERRAPLLETGQTELERKREQERERLRRSA